MIATETTVEPRYSSSGKIGWAFLPLSIGVLGISAGLAFVLYFASRHGFYFIFIAPLLAALVQAGILLLAVSWGHCRSPLVAALLGVVAGLVLYLGRYHIDMISRFGLTAAWKFQVLPRYIALHMVAMTTSDDADTVQGLRQGNPQAARQVVPDDVEVFVFDNQVLLVRKSHREAANWCFFALELGCVLLFTAGAGWIRAKKPYCETCRHWMMQDLAFFHAGQGKTIAEAFESRALSRLAELPCVTIGPNARYAATAVEYCPGVQGQTVCPIYFSVKEVWKGGGAGQFNQFDAVPGQMLIRRRRLSREQAEALAAKFQSLRELLEKSGPIPTLTLAVQSSGPAPLADIRPVESPFNHKIMTVRSMIIRNLLILFISLLFFGGEASALLGLYRWLPDNPGANADNSEKIPLYIFMIALGVPLAVVGGFLGLRKPSCLATWYLRNQARRELRSRPNPIVDPEDPEAIFVEVVPRKNWGRMMLETATDVGFILVDPARQELRFEGDCETYRIPGGAILSCEVEEFTQGQGTAGSVSFYPTVIRANHASGTWEAPVLKRGDVGSSGNDQRLERAQDLCAKIRSIIPPLT